MVPCSRSKPMRDKVQSVTSTNWTQMAHVHAWLSLWEIGGGNTGQGKESSLLSSHLPTQSSAHNTYYISLQQACLAYTRVSDQQNLELVVTATRKNRNMWNECTYLLVIHYNTVTQLFIITGRVELNRNCLRLCLMFKLIVFDPHRSQYQQTFVPSSGILYRLPGYGTV